MSAAIPMPAPMVVAAARALCKRDAEICNIDYEAEWKEHGGEYVKDAQTALDAAGALELLAALQHAESVYRLNVVKDGEPSSTLANMQAAIAKALGSAA
jgi:hypothetical protein